MRYECLRSTQNSWFILARPIDLMNSIQQVMLPLCTIYPNASKPRSVSFIAAKQALALSDTPGRLTFVAKASASSHKPDRDRMASCQSRIVAGGPHSLAERRLTPGRQPHPSPATVCGPVRSRLRRQYASRPRERSRPPGAHKAAVRNLRVLYTVDRALTRKRGQDRYRNRHRLTGEARQPRRTEAAPGYRYR